MDLPIRFVFSKLVYIKNKKLRPHAERLNMTSGQPKVMDYLSFHEGSTQKQLAQGCGVESATMSGILDGLVKKNYIEKRIDPECRREYKIFFTKEGKKKHLEIQAILNGYEERALSVFTKEEKEQFREMLDRYYNAWENEIE